MTLYATGTAASINFTEIVFNGEKTIVAPSVAAATRPLTENREILYLTCIQCRFRGSRRILHRYLVLGKLKQVALLSQIGRALLCVSVVSS